VRAADSHFLTSVDRTSTTSSQLRMISRMQQFRLPKLSSYSAVQVGARQCTLMIVHSLSTKKRLHSEHAISADWIFLKRGGACPYSRDACSCNCGHYLHDAGLSYCDSKTVSLELLRRLNARSKWPTILSWWAEDDKGDILQRFGVPAFSPRLHYTASCIDQAYACVLNVASPDLYRECQCFIYVYLIPCCMSQTILVTFEQYPHVVETIHVKLLVEEWSMVQALHQGLIALFALLT
jgi:hypothetical protein